MGRVAARALAAVSFAQQRKRRSRVAARRSSSRLTAFRRPTSTANRDTWSRASASITQEATVTSFSRSGSPEPRNVSAASRKNRLNQTLRDLLGSGLVQIVESPLSQRDRLSVAFQVPLTVLTHPQVIVEPDLDGRGELAGQVIHHEVGKFTARHTSSPGSGRVWRLAPPLRCRMNSPVTPR